MKSILFCTQLNYKPVPMKNTLTFFLTVALSAVVFVQTAQAVNETKTVGSSGADYASLKDAFDAINAGSLTGAVTLQIINGGNPYGTTTATLNASGGPANYTSVLIYPTSAGSYISCHNAGSGTPAIILNGADNVTIDGRVNQSGSTPALIIDAPSDRQLSSTTEPATMWSNIVL